MKKLILLLIPLLAFTGCQSQKNLSHSIVEDIERDTTSVQDSSATSLSANTSQQVSSSENLTDNTSSHVSDNDEETIHEHITETIDSSGNRTITTDRTIHRNRQHEQHDSTSQQQNTTVDASSLSSVNMNQTNSHHADSSSLSSSRKDSLEQTAKRGGAATLRNKFSSFFDYIMTIFFLLMIAKIYMLWQGRKQK